MLDINFIRNNVDSVRANCARRRIIVDIDRILTLDVSRRELIASLDSKRAERNQTSKQKPSPEDIERMRAIGDVISRGENELRLVEEEFTALMLQVPNMTHSAVPDGGEEDYRVLSASGDVPKFLFQPKDHEELFTALDLIDFERGAKVTGTKFFFVKNDLVRLNHALISYGIDIVAKHGYTLMETPDLAKDEISQGIGFSPRGPETQVYSIENSDLSLIGTAEITVGGYHAGEILDLSDGPKKYVALSHCFRTEGGAYGRTSKGLYRVHQFTKLEMFVFCKQEDSEAMHKEILSIEEELVSGLGLPYRVIDVACADLGGPAYRKYDIEAWMVMKGDYGEITSASNCTDYQSRRLGIRYRDENGETKLTHTLNGTALNNVRWPLAIAENYQNEDGSIEIPKALQEYMNGQTQIKR